MIVKLTKRLFEKLSRKSYRDAYVAENVRTGIAYQIRALREQREWNQGKFSDELRKPQSVTSRLEDPDYGKMTLTTLLEVASTFDVALVIKFVGFGDFLHQYNDVSTAAMRVKSFDETAFMAASKRDHVVADVSAVLGIYSLADIETQENSAGIDATTQYPSDRSSNFASASYLAPGNGAASIVAAIPLSIN